MPTEAKNRERPIITMTLSPEAIGLADELALRRGMSRSQLVEFLVREEALRFQLSAPEAGRRERKKRGLPKLS
jgi:hypothetical protein